MNRSDELTLLGQELDDLREFVQVLRLEHEELKRRVRELEEGDCGRSTAASVRQAAAQRIGRTDGRGQVRDAVYG